MPVWKNCLFVKNFLVAIHFKVLLRCFSIHFFLILVCLIYQSCRLMWKWILSQMGVMFAQSSTSWLKRCHSWIYVSQALKACLIILHLDATSSFCSVLLVVWKARNTMLPLHICHSPFFCPIILFHTILVTIVDQCMIGGTGFIEFHLCMHYLWMESLMLKTEAWWMEQLKISDMFHRWADNSWDVGSLWWWYLWYLSVKQSPRDYWHHEGWKEK